MEKSISFKNLSSIRNFSTEFSQLGNAYIFSRISGVTDSYLLARDPVRVSGLTFCLLLKGDLSIEINDITYDLTPVSLLLLHSSAVVTVKQAGKTDIDAYMLFISQQFLQDLNINLNTLDISIIDDRPAPVLAHLSDDEQQTLKAYMELLDRNAHINTENAFSKNAGLSLVQALLYQLMQIKYDHTSKIAESDDHLVNRRMSYVHDFIKLVQAHHCKERQLSFYAERLYISPKYLSRLIKESTGRSAAAWIDHFVLLEAKNMLRFSNKNIQQVAYALNFSTQSSFGKFFKHLTGMSPSDYQKT